MAPRAVRFQIVSNFKLNALFKIEQLTILSQVIQNRRLRLADSSLIVHLK